MSNIIYFNNAATSFPKPTSVINHIHEALYRPSSDSSRSCNCKKKNSDSDVICKSKLRKFFKLSNVYDIIFTNGATHSLNSVINHLVNDLNITTCYCTQQEHNSVYRTAHEKFKSVNFLNYISKSVVDVSDLSDGSCIFLNHMCNVDGNVLDIPQILSTIKNSNVPVIIDITQSAGIYDIDISKWDYLNLYIVCSTHKGMMSLESLGFFTKPKHVKFSPFILGGTGKDSLITTRTTSLEAGTPNSIAIESLIASINYINNFGLNNIKNTKRFLCEYYLKKIKTINNYNLYKKLFILDENNINLDSGIITLKVNSSKANMFVESLNSNNIIVRHGLHCSPIYHINILKCESTIRISFGLFNTKSQIDKFCECCDNILAQQNYSYSRSLLSDSFEDGYNCASNSTNDSN